MTSKQIPESIVGVPLTTPSARNQFSINAAGGPGGQDSLLISGGTSSNYSAFQSAPSLSPDPFRTKGNQEFCISFWLKLSGPFTAATGQLNPLDFLFGVHNASFNGTQVQNRTWSVTGYSTDQIQFSGASRTGGSSSSSSFLARTGSLGTGWNLIVFVHTAGMASTSSIDPKVAVNDAGSYTIGSRYSESLTGNPSDPFFCIGPYSEDVGLVGLDVNWELFGLSIHDHELNTTERLLLYESGLA